MLIDILTRDIEIGQKIFYVLIMLFALTLSFSIHEFMHANTADWLGDPTPRNMGRLTLNPMAHLDPMGTVLLLVAGFGWGKPVVYNPNKLKRFKSYRLMNIMVHLAGVTGNFILALICGVIYIPLMAFGDAGNTAIMALQLILYYTMMFSLSLLAFNLLPIPPLDGFHVLEELFPIKWKYSEWYRKFQKFAPMIIWIVFLAGSRIPFLGTAIQWIMYPFIWVITFLGNGLVQLLSNFF